MEPTSEPLNPSSEKTVRQESEDDFQLVLDTFSILFFLLGCLNPVVLLTVFFGKKKLQGRWLVICGLVAGLVAGGFFNAVSLYLTPVLEITELMRGNMLKLMHGGSADSVVDLVLNRAGTWFCAQLPFGVPVGLIIAGDIIHRRSAGRDENNA